MKWYRIGPVSRSVRVGDVAQRHRIVHLESTDGMFFVKVDHRGLLCLQLSLPCDQPIVEILGDDLQAFVQRLYTAYRDYSVNAG